VARRCGRTVGVAGGDRNVPACARRPIPNGQRNVSGISATRAERGDRHRSRVATDGFSRLQRDAASAACFGGRIRSEESDLPGRRGAFPSTYCDRTANGFTVARKHRHIAPNSALAE